MTTCLNVAGLGKTFGGLAAVDDVSFALRAGELVSLIGPNGAGKTTLFNMITGFTEPTRGTVTLDNRPITRAKPHQIARLGVVRTFQITSVFEDLTVEQNVQYASFLHRRRALWRNIFSPGFRRASDLQDLAHARDILARLGLAKRAHETAGSLSYGELRLLEIAIALAARPCVLLLDEPAAGLNNEESARLKRILRALVADLNLAILLVEHDMTVVMEISDRIIVINFGKMIAQGDARQILADPQVRDAYLGDVQRLLGENDELRKVLHAAS